MKALLVAAAPSEGTTELVARLGPEADVIIAVDGGGGVCLDALVSPHVLVGDFDSIDPAVLEWLEEAGTRIVGFPAEKDETDLELALAEAERLGAEEVTVTAAFTDRVDHTLAALGALARVARLRPRLEEPHMRGWILGHGARESLAVSGLGRTVSLIALGAAARVSIAGVRWPLSDHVLQPLSGLGVSNLVTSREGAVIEVHDGVIVALCPVVAESGSPQPS